ncbi:peptide ABC transporter substrate-binding protein [Bradyrhizobium sp. SSUT18]|uniref:peptide ABC transporter substrate-binding protein n=1 Tax=Bradyrhizobium sp. SSUT18 TaxID=3040602 RepID=UPI0024473486|nr:peptide ABC transporter substrate-binding protein [Bradyrhizobium sp. SSUT18]MDH2405283.1 peptide ABC transporter substrate-binding protein [Bradyrhizobium sp. SSUT18]
MLTKNDMLSQKAILGAATLVALTISPAIAGRGSDGELKLLYWQAPSILNPYLSGGIKDVDASSLVIEPLAHYDENGKIVPTLAAEVPTLGNNGISKDLMSITWKLKPGIMFSDGSPFTADDVVFTADYCMNLASGCNFLKNFQDVTTVEALDPLTVKISFKVAKASPYGPFVGSQVPVLQKAQFKDCTGAKAPHCTTANFGPIGTGPFKVVDFKANDRIRFVANGYYREPNKPAFASALFKGGGDAASAARAVLETGEFDYGWNLQVEPDILKQMQAAGKGKLNVAFGTGVERIETNFTNADPSLGADKRSVYMDGKNPNPVLSDSAMRTALSLATDRQVIVDAGYGSTGKVTCNVVPAPEAIASTTNDWCKTPNIDKANKILDDAGWMKGADGVRVREGVRAQILFQTTTNSVRQGTQALLKQMWQQIGVSVELRNINASVFFGSDPSSPDTYQKFMADLEMLANSMSGIDPEVYLASWTCGKIPQPSNNWIGPNGSRYCNKNYDALAGELGQAAEPDKRANIAKMMNDMLIADGVIIPLVHVGKASGIANSIGGDKMNAWDSEMWNIADWYRTK